ncbi:MAG: Flp family type IVb pilin [Sphingopyxis sp.]
MKRPDFQRCERGSTAIEYALIAALVAVSSLTAVNGMGTRIAAFFDNVAPYLSDAARH